MLVLSATKTSISIDCTTVVITDSTGVYNNPNNLTGYNAPNQARATLALFVALSIRRSDGRVTLTIPTYNKFTAATWSVTDTEDGWHEIYFFGCLAWSAIITYALNYITYDASTDKFYKSLQAGNINHSVTDASWWVATTSVDDFAVAINLVQPDTYETTTNYLEQCRSLKCEAAMLVAAGCNCDDNDGCKMQAYEKVRMKNEGAAIQAADGNYTEAQEITEDVTSICGDCNCGCN